MGITFIDNIDIILTQELYKSWEKCDEIVVCSAFLSESEFLSHILQSDKKITIVSRKTHPLKPDFLEWIFKNKKPQHEFYFYTTSSYHPKIYLFLKNNHPFDGIIGSSNFTEPGLSHNFEYNVKLDTDLEKIHKKCTCFINKAEEIISSRLVEQYKKDYVKPQITEHPRTVRINQSIKEEYNGILLHWNTIRGMLKGVREEWEKRFNLPFAYLFDTFVHSYKTKFPRDHPLLTNQLTPSRDVIIKAFEVYLENYYDKNWVEIQMPKRFDLNKQIRETDIQYLSETKIRDFFLSLHCIGYGSGCGVRKKAIRKEALSNLKRILEFMKNNEFSVDERVAIALTPKNRGGEKVRYLGYSAIREILGWLYPEEYPIINEKFIFALRNLGFQL